MTPEKLALCYWSPCPGFDRNVPAQRGWYVVARRDAIVGGPFPLYADAARALVALGGDARGA
jgi:hypothetical protein